MKNICGPDAYEFRPERWEGGEIANIGWAYFPFNGHGVDQDSALGKILP